MDVAFHYQQDDDIDAEKDLPSLDQFGLVPAGDLCPCPMVTSGPIIDAVRESFRVISRWLVYKVVG